MAQQTINVQVSADKYDVIVAGGGLTGVCAAVGAAREGSRVLLLEATGALGGMATMGLVPVWCGAHNQQEIIHSGLCRKIIDDCWEGNAEKDCLQKNLYINPEKLKLVCDRMLSDNGVEFLFNTTVAGISKDCEQASGQTRLTSVHVANKAGISVIEASVFIDCTGDADLAAWAGAEFEYGDETGDVQPASHCYTLVNINEAALKEEQEKAGDWRGNVWNNPAYPRIKDNYLGLGNKIFDNLWVCNSGHLWNVDNTDPRNITKALIDGRELAVEILTLLKETFPKAFANASIFCTAPLMGIRETRRIVGDYLLNWQDHKNRQRFSDEIAFNCFMVDIHPSLKKREMERAGTWKWHTEMQENSYSKGEFHGIPYRSLLPKGVSNLLVAGRSISTDRAANSAVRIMPSCMSMGEAAGIAAADAAKNTAADVRKVDVKKIQNKIRETGGFMPEA